MRGKLFLGIAISLIFIYLSFWKPQFGLIFSGSVFDALFGSPRIDMEKLGQSIKTARIVYMLAIMLLVYIGWWIRAWRWQIFAMPIKKVKAKLAFSALMIGYLGNNVMPLRAGEFMRAYVVGKRAEMSMSSALATVVVERVVDMVMLLICFGLSMLLFPIPGLVRKAGIIILVATAGLIGFLMMLIFQRVKALVIAEWMLKFSPRWLREKLLKIVHDFTTGLEVFRRREHYFIAIVWTLVMWALYLFIIYVSFYLFNLVSPEYPEIYKAPFIATIVIVTLTTAGIAIPSAPGAVGTYHGVCLFGMVELFKVPPEMAMSYAILLHLTNFLPMTLIGIYCLFREGLKLTDISGAVREKDSGADLKND